MIKQPPEVTVGFDNHQPPQVPTCLCSLGEASHKVHHCRCQQQLGDQWKEVAAWST